MKGEQAPATRRHFQALRRLKREQTRKKEGLLRVEGLRLFQAALASGWIPNTVLADPSLHLNTPHLSAPSQRLQSLMIQPRLEPVVAWGPAPVPPPLPKGRLLVLDIQDPGNLGTLIRSARGLGVEGVALLPRCPDLYNPRVLRASAGTLFGYPVGAWTESLLKDRTLFVAEAHGGNPVPSPPPQEWLLVLGHETTGTSPLFLGRGVSLTLTLTGVESLGVAAAGAVLMDRLT